MAGASPAETARRAAAGAVPPLARAAPRPARAPLRARSTPACAATRCARPPPPSWPTHLAAARGRRSRAAARGAACAPCRSLASAAGGAALAGAGLAAADGQLAQRIVGRLAPPASPRAPIVGSALAVRLAPAGGRAAGRWSPAASWWGSPRPRPAAILAAVALAVVAAGWPAGPPAAAAGRRAGPVRDRPRAALRRRSPGWRRAGRRACGRRRPGWSPPWPGRSAAGADGLLAGGDSAAVGRGRPGRRGSSPAAAGRAPVGAAGRPARRRCVQAAALVVARDVRAAGAARRPGRPAPGGRRRSGWRRWAPRWSPPPPTRAAPWAALVPAAVIVLALGHAALARASAAACPRGRPLRCDSPTA